MDGLDIEVLTARMVRGEHAVIARILQAMIATDVDVVHVHVEAIVSDDAKVFPTIVIYDGTTVIGRVRWEFADPNADNAVTVRMRVAVHPSLNAEFVRLGGTADIV